MMRTKNQGPSLFSTLGQAFNLHHSPKHGVVAVRRDPRAAKLEYFIAESLFVLLDSLLAQKQLSFTWLQKVVALVNSTISGAQELLPAGVQSPWDEQWISSYLEDSAQLLDVLNFVRKLVVEMEEKQMLLKLVVSTLNSKPGTAEERRVRARKHLVDYSAGSEIKPDAASKMTDCSTLLQKMMPQAFDERSNPPQRGRSFVSALYGAKVMAVFLMGVVVRALGGALPGFSEWQVPEKFAWSKPLEDLLQLVSKVSTCEEKTKSPDAAPVQEMALLNQALEKLRVKLDSSSKLEEQGEAGGVKLQLCQSCGQEDESGEVEEAGDDEAWGLQIALKVSEEGVDLMRKELDNLFHVVVSSRNSLLGRLRGC